MDRVSLARFFLPCPSPVPVPSPAAESSVDVDPFAFRGGGAAAASTPPAVGGPRMGSILPSRRSGAAVWTSCNPALTSRRGGAPLRLTSSRRKLTQTGYTSDRGWQVRFTTLRERIPFKRAHARERERDRKARNPLLPPYFLVHRPRRLYDPSAAAPLFKRNAQRKQSESGRLYFFLAAVLAFLPPLPPASFLSSPCASKQASTDTSIRQHWTWNRCRSI